MRWAAGFCLLLVGCSSCRSKETATEHRGERVADASSASLAPPPPVVVFEDAGDGGTLDLGHGITLDVRPAGPSLVLVDLHEPTKPKPAWKKIRIERKLVGGNGETQIAELDNYAWGHPSHMEHSAEPGSTFTYRAKLEENGTWKDVTVRTADPKTPPPPPAKVAASAETPWAVELTWEVDARAVAGIEVDVQDGDADGSEPWKLLSIANPHESRLAHGYRRPKQTSRYRIATFNRNGKSAFVETAAVTTPEAPSKPAPPKPLPPCTTLPPPSDRSASLGDSMIQTSPELWSFAGGPGGIAPRRLFGQYRGCMRELGAFELQGDTLTTLRPDAPPTEGFPVLVGILGAGLYAGVQLGTYAFTNGRYEEVDRAQFCGEASSDSANDPRSPYAPKLDGEVTQRRGPFDGCLNETPLR